MHVLDEPKRLKEGQQCLQALVELVFDYPETSCRKPLCIVQCYLVTSACNNVWHRTREAHAHLTTRLRNGMVATKTIVDAQVNCLAGSVSALDL